MPENPDHLTLAASRLKMGVIAAVLLLTLLLGVWFFGEIDDPLIRAWSWIGMLALGLGLLSALFQMRRPSRLELTPEGFQVTGMFGTGVIPWSDVEAFFVHAEPVSNKGHGEVAPHAAWRLSETAEARHSVLSRISRLGLEGEVDGTIPRYFGSSPEAMADLLESWRVRYS